MKDTTHQYLPKTWEFLVPEGVIHQNLVSPVRTGMTAGTFCMFTGYNDNYRFSRRHPLMPTIFEYYRKSNPINQERVWFITRDELNRSGIDHSLHPFWGEEYGAASFIEEMSDVELAHKAVEILQVHHPLLASIHFNDIDTKAQTSSWEDYITAIRKMDMILYELYQYLQEDPFYRDKTTLIITTAHGRHDDDVQEGFHWHGCACNGCRDLMFLAIGPDFKKGVEITDRRGELWDIAPTVGELLGFEACLSEGRVLTELFSLPRHRIGEPFSRSFSGDDDEILLSSPGFDSRHPSLAINRSGIHSCWRQRRSDPDNSWSIIYRRGLDEGTIWEDAITLLESDEETLFVCPTIAAGDSVGCWMLTSGYALQPYPERLAWVWSIWGRRSEDGMTWDTPFSKMTVDVIDKWIASYISHDDIFFHFLDSRWVRYSLSSFDGGGNWDYFRYSFEPPSNWDNLTIKEPSILGDILKLHCVEIASKWVNSFVYYTYHFRGSDTWSTPVVLSPPRLDVYAMHPAIVSNRPSSNDTLHVCWADNREGQWGIYLKSSTNYGCDWSDDSIRVNENTADAWNCDITAYGDTLAVVWEDYRHGESEIYGRVSYDFGFSWEAEIRLSESPGLSCAPRIVHDPSSSTKNYVIWQDNRSGTWQIYVTVFDPFLVAVELPGIQYVSEPGRIRFQWRKQGIFPWKTVSYIREVQSPPNTLRSPAVRFSEGEIIDPSPIAGRIADYRLEFRTASGRKTLSEPLQIVYQPPGTSTGGLVLQATPNPFNPVTVIRYVVPRNGGLQRKINLSIYDVQGGLVKELVDSWSDPGVFSARWQGDSTRGTLIGSGIYYCRFAVDGNATTRKLLLLK